MTQAERKLIFFTTLEKVWSVQGSIGQGLASSLPCGNPSGVSATHVWHNVGWPPQPMVLPVVWVGVGVLVVEVLLVIMLVVLLLVLYSSNNNRSRSPSRSSSSNSRSRWYQLDLRSLGNCWSSAR